MGSISLFELLGANASLRKWSRSLALAAGVALGGWEATAVAQEPISTAPQNLNDVIQPIGLRHLFNRGGYCDDCVPCQPAMPGEEIAPGQPMPEQPMPDYSEPASEPVSSNFGFANMLGDSPFGGCVTLNAGAFQLDMAHPRFACERANLAENNSALPNDRVFFSYRRFINATEVSVFDDVGFSNGVFENGSSVLDIDQYTIGFERTMFCEQASFELRVPFTYQLGSQFNIDAVTTDSNPNFLSGIPITDRVFELGNVSFIFKYLLKETSNFALSGGFGVSLPTAKNVSTIVRLQDTSYAFDFYSGGTLVSDVTLGIGTVVGNEIVNMTPYLAFAYAPNDRVFHQGFGQIDVPLNDASVRYSINGTVSNSQTQTSDPNDDDTLHIDPLASDFDINMSQQTIARLNYQFGYWFFRDDNASRLRGVAGLFELHYTTTLNNARGNSIILDPNHPDAAVADANKKFIQALGGDPAEVFHLFDVKNEANRVDTLNLALGMAFRYGMTDLQAGYVMPLRDGDDKPFDGEFHVFANRSF